MNITTTIINTFTLYIYKTLPTSSRSSRSSNNNNQSSQRLLPIRLNAYSPNISDTVSLALPNTLTADLASKKVLPVDSSGTKRKHINKMPSSIRKPLPSQPQTSSSVSPLKRKAMSITQTYFLAHTARGKLSAEAAQADHNLRLLVGHANLLDSLMLELAEAEQEQESWFNQSVRAATKTVESPKHIQWADSIVEEPEQDWQAEDADSSDSDSEFDEEDEDVEMVSAESVSLKRVQSQQSLYKDESDEEFEEDDEEDYASLSLARTPSRSAQPPELSHDSDDSSSDDESMPPSPPSTSLNFSEKQRQQIATTSFYESQAQKLSPTEQASFFDEGYYLPQRSDASLVSAISVY